MCKLENLDLKDRTLIISKLGKVKFYYRSIPHEDRIIDIRESRLTRINGDYYLSLTLTIARDFSMHKTSKPIGIDWGIHNLLTISDGKNECVVPNFLNYNKHGKITNIRGGKVAELWQKIAKIDKAIFRKIFINTSLDITTKSNSNNILKLMSRRFYYYQRINNIKSDYLNKTVWRIAKRNPLYIQIEDLKVAKNLKQTSSMTSKDKMLRKLIGETSSYKFRKRLKSVCIRERIELRTISPYFPSTKRCSKCGKLISIGLAERTYRCPHCGLKIDRDVNAARNILNCKDYTVLVDAFGNPVG